MRNYTVLNHEIRTGRNVKQLIHRAAQFSQSAPQGPSYLIASRETLEEEIPPYEVNPKKYRPLAPKALDPASVKEIGEALINAKLPVVITSYVGKHVAAVPELVKLAEATGLAVLVGLRLVACDNLAIVLTEGIAGSRTREHELPT